MLASHGVGAVMMGGSKEIQDALHRKPMRLAE